MHLWMIMVYLVPLAMSENLPSFMEGNFQMQSKTGLDPMMKALGVDWVTRRVANRVNPQQFIYQRNGEVHMNLNIPNMNLGSTGRFAFLKTHFRLNTPWREYRSDGQMTNTVTKVVGNKIIKHQQPLNRKRHATTEVREFLDMNRDGVYETMKLIVTIPGKRSVRPAVATFQRMGGFYSLIPQQNLPVFYNTMPLVYGNAPMAYHNVMMPHNTLPMTYHTAASTYNDESIAHNEKPISNNIVPVSYHGLPLLHHNVPFALPHVPIMYNNLPLLYNNVPIHFNKLSTNEDESKDTVVDL